MKLHVIPEPLYFNILKDETAFTFSDSVCFDGKPESEKSINDLVRFTKEVFCYEIVSGGKEKIRFSINSELSKKESYTLKIEKDFIEIKSGDENGLFYAVQTLKQLLFQTGGKLPYLEIKDEPEHALRSFMLDCGRYFFTVEAVKQFLDMMALHKFNEFHWHLTEDHGFRCQLDCAPLLTEIGAYRSHTNFNNKPHGGFYTKAQMKEIIDYAHDRYIKVVPEIDIPGHTVSMLASHPELGCFGREMEVATHWGIKHDVLCAGKEITYVFVEKILTELIEIFPDKTVHLGGDEVPTTRWELCPDCNARMKKEGLKEYHDLHTYFLERVSKFLLDKGIEVRMWNDKIKPYMVNKDVTWHLWNGDMKKEDVEAEIRKGRKFVLSCSEWNYLDLPYGLTSLKKCYGFDFDVKKEGVLGIEACLWSEFVPDMKKADYLTYPRLGAISETAWCKKENKSYESFLRKLPSYTSLLLTLGVMPAKESRYNPKIMTKLGSKIYWERRRLCWAGLSNLVTNAQMKHKYGKKEKAND